MKKRRANNENERAVILHNKRPSAAAMKKEREGILFNSAEKLKYLLFCIMTFLQCNYEKMLEF